MMLSGKQGRHSILKDLICKEGEQPESNCYQLNCRKQSFWRAVHFPDRSLSQHLDHTEGPQTINGQHRWNGFQSQQEARFLDLMFSHIFVVHSQHAVCV